jgi:hypothetical protein
MRLLCWQWPVPDAFRSWKCGQEYDKSTYQFGRYSPLHIYSSCVCVYQLRFLFDCFLASTLREASKDIIWERKFYAEVVIEG